VFPAGTSMAEVDRARDILGERGMSDRVLMVAGIEQLAVLKGEATDGD
jgi:hypothetical protein